ncbi:MAG: hypothetical protein ACF8MJ_14015 [Phycisphaerales bacterium JB050]
MAEREQGDAPIYVGYLPTPRREKRLLRIAVPVLLWIGAMAAGLVAWRMQDPGTGIWDTSNEQTWEGVLHADPYPLLEIDGAGTTEVVLLVEMGKTGTDRARAFDGRRVSVTGFELERDGRRIFELVPEDRAISAIEGEVVGGGFATTPVRSVTLRGEIMDSKCFLGAMKPGEGQGHRACAILCIRGGIPPMLVTRDAAGTASYYLLVNEDGSGLAPDALDRIGEPVEITGELRHRGDLMLLAIDPETVRGL